MEPANLGGGGAQGGARGGSAAGGCGAHAAGASGAGVGGGSGVDEVDKLDELWPSRPSTAAAMLAQLLGDSTSSDRLTCGLGGFGYVSPLLCISRIVRVSVLEN